MEEIETIGIGMHWEDLPVGRRFKTIGRTITEADIINFVNCTGMVEVIFTDVEFQARQSRIKGRLAPGALVYTFAEGILTQYAMQGVGFAFLSMEQEIKAPVVAGDTIHVECEVVECRESSTRPGLGLVRSINKIVKQDGTVVQVYKPLRMVKGKKYKAA